MKKMILGGLLATVLAAPAYAEGAFNTQPITWTDIYTGGQLGATFFELQKNIYSTTIPATPGGATHDTRANPYSNDTGVDGSIFLGLGRRINQFYIGTEASAEWTSARTTVHYYDNFQTNNVTNSAHESLKSIYGISLLPGLYIAPNNRIYGRAGFVGGTVQGRAASYMGTEAYSGNFNKTLYGYRLGAGLDSMFTPHWSMRVEYDYTHLSQFSLSNRITASAGGGGTTNYSMSTNFRPSSNEILVGFSYHFLPGTAC